MSASTQNQALAAMLFLYKEVLRRGAGWVELPGAIGVKYPNAGRAWAWQWVFPATGFYRDAPTGQRRRHHLLEHGHDIRTVQELLGHRDVSGRRFAADIRRERMETFSAAG